MPEKYTEFLLTVRVLVLEVAQTKLPTVKVQFPSTKEIPLLAELLSMVSVPPRVKLPLPNLQVKSPDPDRVTL